MPVVTAPSSRASMRPCGARDRSRAGWREPTPQGGCAVYTGCDTSLVLNLDGVALFALGDLGQSGGADYEIEESSWGQRKTFQVDPRRPAVPGQGLRVWKGEKLVGVSLMGDLTKMQAWKTQLLKERDGGK